MLEADIIHDTSNALSVSNTTSSSNGDRFPMGFSEGDIRLIIKYLSNAKKVIVKRYALF